MKQHAYLVFATSAKNSGNSALVITDFSGTDAEMQSMPA